MNNRPLGMKEWSERISLAALFTGIGALIMLVFSPLRPLLEGSADTLGRIGLIGLLLTGAWLAGKNRRIEKYRQLIVGLLIMTVAVSLDWFFGNTLMDSLGVDGKTPDSFALLKLTEGVVVTGVIVTLTRLSENSLGSIYLQKGNMKLGLSFGGIAFVVCAVGAIPMTWLMFKPGEMSLARLMGWTPWLLVSILANATQEELLFRGLFLRKLEPFFGKFLSNFLIVIVFTLLHKGIMYTANGLAFWGLLLALGLAWGGIMQKTDSIWGSILFHAGTDIPVFLGIFSNL